MNPILVLALAIAFHEFGHWIIPHYEGLKPKIKISWLFIGVEFESRALTPIRMLIDTRILGIILGIPVIVIFGNPGDLWFLFTFYFLFSSADILMIMMLKIKAHRQDALWWCELEW